MASVALLRRDFRHCSRPPTATFVHSLRVPVLALAANLQPPAPTFALRIVNEETELNIEFIH